ncbi:unnamed protein product [Rotaria sp. Silwood1]|nr:unnamed protein product [Rotaria sp. Silwood1]CAF1639660.1 unnamed protein product [Rotaria sp. Silwood1]CAF3801917.1 unnamed protein product [Rotaria sp. Silwood1]CAF3840345.1 unnamed protein product [Rotaria sp. Silwood1]CAF3855820.1 unnamed protein product [Rotaria sp. Silwood1]
MMNRFGDIDTSFKNLPPVYGYHVEKLVPIEKALEPIEPQINELPRFIKIAKRNCHFPSERGLTHDQSAAVYIYTMEWGNTSLYHMLNKALRSENRQALKIWFPYLKLFDTALDKLPTVKGAVWRVHVRYQSVLLKIFLTTTKIQRFFMIEAVKGIQISGYTGYENEDEIILRMGSRFRVKSNPLDLSYGPLVVHLIEIDDNNDQTLISVMNEIQPAITLSTKSTSGKLFFTFF